MTGSDSAGLLVEIRKKLKAFTLDVSFKTGGEYLGFLGASGSGKSMTLKCISGIKTPDEGRIILNGRVLFDSVKGINLKPQERNIGYLFQNYALFPHMTVAENIAIGLSCVGKEREQKVREMLNAFHLEGLEKKYPNKLSGGQQQRVALARCLVYRPDVLMLDEPFSALDSHLRDQLQVELMGFLKLHKGEVLMVTHNRDEVYRICQNIMILDEGKSVLFGNTRQIFRCPEREIAARLTGCKNISPCEILSAHHLRALDWNIVIDTEKEVPPETKYVGIRAHEFVMMEPVNSMTEKNMVQCRIAKVIEDLFEYNVFLENGLLYKVKKAEWDSLKNKESLFLKIPQEAILLLE
jgi:molybdate transport system ATP-binding protein